MATRSTSEIAEYIRERRVARGLSLDALSSAASISPARLTAAEAGELLPTSTEAVRLAAELRIDAASIWRSNDLTEARFRSSEDEGPSSTDIAELERRVRHFRRVRALYGS